MKSIILNANQKKIKLHEQAYGVPDEVDKAISRDSDKQWYSLQGKKICS